MRFLVLLSISAFALAASTTSSSSSSSASAAAPTPSSKGSTVVAPAPAIAAARPKNNAEKQLDVITQCTNKGEFAMSFDDGPFTFGHSIARTFEEHGGLATFFVNGFNYDCIYDYAPELIARYKAGHLIASHTWNHIDMTAVSLDVLKQQLDLLETALMKILGIKPRFFRPPYGAYNEASLQYLKSRGYETVTWSFDSGDSEGVSPAKSVSLFKSYAKHYPTSQMPLTHETYAGTANYIVPKVVPMLLAKGYKLVTIAKCLSASPYQFVGQPSQRDASWTCAGTPAPASN